VRYRTIVADPPWPSPQGFAAGHSRTPGKWEKPRTREPLKYPSMTFDAIKSIPVAEWAEPDARLFLWTTNRWLPMSFDVLLAWGFIYRQVLVWHKSDVNLPSHIAPNSAEFILIGVCGHPERIGTLPTSVFTTARGKRHSAKPECFLDMVEQVSPGPYLELFARRRRLGWHVWGDEVDSDITLEATAS